MKQPPETEVAEFLSQVDRLVSLLDAEGETFWRTRIAGAASKVRNSDWQGFDDFLSGYGTSGSFNECSIRTGEWQGDNHVWKPDDKLRYQEFEDLKGSAYGLARSLSRLTAPSVGESLAGVYRLASIRTKALLWLMLLLLLGAIVLGRP
ncbi:hypothetical protein LJR290_007825 [Variovorax sp. LjRoot290]|uniref:DUF6966 domain-containing protein n=1 Tax=Variovorax sp. LjRoot290 TaxID=3342316 RepID=UPI003ECDDA0F